MSLVVPNCIIEECNPYIIIRSCIYGLEIKMLEHRINVDDINDFHNSFEYITEFLLLNNFKDVSYNKCKDDFYNLELNIRVYININGYYIERYRTYRSREFLEIMHEILGLNDVNKLAVKE